MTKSNINPPEEDDDDDKEQDISDDPILNAINTELNSVGKRNDNKLILALLILVVLTQLYKLSAIKSSWLDIIFGLAIVAVIGRCFLGSIRENKQVAAKYGLICSACGYKPKAHMLLSAARTQRCSKCKNPLIVNSESK